MRFDPPPLPASCGYSLQGTQLPQGPIILGWERDEAVGGSRGSNPAEIWGIMWQVDEIHDPSRVVRDLDRCEHMKNAVVVEDRRLGMPKTPP